MVEASPPRESRLLYAAIAVEPDEGSMKKLEDRARDWALRSAADAKAHLPAACEGAPRLVEYFQRLIEETFRTAVLVAEAEMQEDNGVRTRGKR